MRTGKLLYLILVLWIAQHVTAQISPSLQSFKTFLETNHPPGLDSSMRSINIMPAGMLHYLYPLYQLFGMEENFKKWYPEGQYYNLLSQSAAFTEDYESALYYQQKSYSSTVDDIAKRQVAKLMATYKNIQHVDARRFLLYEARNQRVIMFNESYNKPVHRAFILSMLGDFYRRGFRYLAMEMLNNRSNRELTKLTQESGFYTAEPLAGEMVRTALDLGFTLVAYEDTLATNHSATERDSIQAANIYKVIQQDTTARILVYAGYGSIAEKNSWDSSYVPMAMAFKRISGIDPLTVDQVDMTEESNFAFGKYFYDTYIQKFPVQSPSIATINDQPINVTGSSLYDLAIIHPPTVYRDARPVWMNLGGRRQPLYIKPTNKNTFLVQAFYQLETYNGKPGTVVPADQTYIPGNKGSYLLYLKRGQYIVLFRNMKYRVLYSQHVEVN
jgi:hypothetical protein